MSALFLVILLIGVPAGLLTVNQEERVYTVSEVSEKPEPLRGLRDFQDRWSKRVRYPEEALRKKVQGVVFIEFQVNPDSSVVEAAVRSGIGAGCDEAALEAFREVAKGAWKPGIRNGEPVKVKMVLPFYFRII